MTENLPRLSGRLMAAASMVTPGLALTDVGCDHAHIPIWLKKQGLVPSVLAMDCIPGPLEKAAGNLALYGMEGEIALRLSDGLDAYEKGEGQCLMITGLGGKLMKDILTRQPDKTRDFQELVLSPQSDRWMVRASLRDLGFGIDKEALVEEDGKFYPVIHALRGAEGKRPLWKEEADEALRLPAEDWFGPCLIRDRDPVLYRFLVRQERTQKRILASLEGAADPARTRDRKEQALWILAMVRMALVQYM